MNTKPKKIRSHCPVNFCLEYLGDRWSLLIIRDIVFRGKKTFGQFLSSEEGFATNILTNRLEQMCEKGILKREQDGTDRRNISYNLTQKGLDLIPVLFEMVLWSSQYDSHSEAKRIPKLIQEIEQNNRAISKKAEKVVSAGGAFVKEYLQPVQ